MSVGKNYVYKLAQRTLGDHADEWLDTPRLGLGETLTATPTTPRSLIESGCPACISSVADALESLTGECR